MREIGAIAAGLAARWYIRRGKAEDDAIGVKISSEMQLFCDLAPVAVAGLIYAAFGKRE